MAFKAFILKIIEVIHNMLILYCCVFNLRSRPIRPSFPLAVLELLSILQSHVTDTNGIDDASGQAVGSARDSQHVDYICRPHAPRPPLWWPHKRWGEPVVKKLVSRRLRQCGGIGRRSRPDGPKGPGLPRVAEKEIMPWEKKGAGLF